jgi:uncharacterized delta-60 repeat protein
MNNKNTITFFLIIFFLTFTQISFSQFGQLDHSFGQNGIVTTAINVNGSNNVSRSAAMQNDGKIIVGGYSYLAGESDNGAIVRYNTDGILDNTFGTNGIVINPFGSSGDVVNSIAIQEDGKIVAAGYLDNGDNNDFAVARFNNDGSFDDTFGTSGVVITPVGDEDDVVYSVAIQDDGKIVVAGTFYNGSNYDFALVRYNPNGFIDNTFGTSGVVITPVGDENDIVYSIAIQEDDKIVAAGYSDNGNNFDFALARYHPNGALDSNFGTNGKVTTQVGTLNDFVNSVAMQSNGKIVAAGYFYNGSDLDIAIVCYNANGTLDDTFGNQGIVVTQIGTSDDAAHTVTIQSDGKIVAAGYSDNGNDYDFALMRYNPNGDLDDTFGTNGIVTTAVGSFYDYIRAVAIQNDGEIVAAGLSSNGTDYDIAVARYNESGSLDNTFGNSGTIITPWGTTQSEVRSVAVQSDGKILAAGISHNGNDYDFSLVRYNSNGTLDNTFGSNGIVITQIDSTNDIAFAVAMQPGGSGSEKIIVAGYHYEGNNYDFAITRYNLNGALDNTFGTGGITITPLGSSNDFLFAMTIQSDGKIVTVGRSFNGNDGDIAVVRYNSYGTPDNTFGTNGIVTTDINSENDVAYSVNVQSDGKIIVAGYTDNGTDYDIFVIRYNSNGTMDNTFGNNGIIITQVGSSDEIAYSVKVQSDGKILTAGYSSNGNDNDFAVIRYNENGSLDNTFGTNGIVTTQVGASGDYAYSISIQNDGKIVLSGCYYTGTTSDIALVRYNSNGTLDNTFGTNGIVIIEIGSSSNCAYTSAIQNDGKIVVAGKSENGSNYSVFTTVRYLDDASTDIDEENSGEIPTEYFLSQNYPNPFNPTTNFEYRIADFGFVSLKVFDVLGKEVATLVNGEKPAGSYKIAFDASGLSSGVYFYKLQSGNFVESKKMILLR